MKAERRWYTIAQIAKRDGITANAARKRTDKATRRGLLERKLVKRGGWWVLAWREWDMRWPKHGGNDDGE